MNKKLIAAVVLSVSQSVSAGGIPVFDGSNLAQAIAQVQQMAQLYGVETEELTNLISQLQELKMMYDTLHNGYDGALKQQAFDIMMSQLPPEFRDLVNGGGNFGNWEDIASQNIFYNIKDAPIEQNSETVKQFENNRTLAAKHSGTFKQLVEDSEFNFQSIRALVDKLREAETVGEKLDNIAESNIVNATLLNQIIKNQATSESYKAERDLAEQKGKELDMYQTPGDTPRFGGIYQEPRYRDVAYTSDGIMIEN